MTPIETEIQAVKKIALQAQKEEGENVRKKQTRKTKKNRRPETLAELSKKFHSFVVKPLKRVDKGDSPYNCFAFCEETDPELAAWGVYAALDLREKRLEHLADCPTKGKAEFLVTVLATALFEYKWLCDAAAVVVTKWKGANLGEAVAGMGRQLPK